MRLEEQVDFTISESIAQHPLRAGSLIITVFGDIISQHGNVVWLGSLIENLGQLGLNARQIRTAVYRLSQNGWLASTQSGRRSHYSFTEFGQRQYEKAARRIYASSLAEWDGQWTLVFPLYADISVREELKRELQWLGFGQITSGVLAHPNPNLASLQETLSELEVKQSVLVLHAEVDDGQPLEIVNQVTRETWKLDNMSQRYDEFVTRFEPLCSRLSAQNTLSPLQAFRLRTIVIHEYRRLLLKTTDLPDQLLPENWSGRRAIEIVSKLYLHLKAASIEYIQGNFENALGGLHDPNASFYHRFG